MIRQLSLQAMLSFSRGQWRGRKGRDARSAGTPGAFFDVTNRCMIRKKKII